MGAIETLKTWGRQLATMRHDYAFGAADTTTQSNIESAATRDMVYLGIVRIKDRSSWQSLHVSAAQLEHVLGRFKSACPEEVRGSLTLVICFGEGHSNGVGGAYGPGHLAINAYRSRTKAEIAEDAADAEQRAVALSSTSEAIERAEYERLKAKFDS